MDPAVTSITGPLTRITTISLLLQTTQRLNEQQEQISSLQQEARLQRQAIGCLALTVSRLKERVRQLGLEGTHIRRLLGGVTFYLILIKRKLNSNVINNFGNRKTKLIIALLAMVIARLIQYWSGIDKLVSLVLPGFVPVRLVSLVDCVVLTAAVYTELRKGFCAGASE